MIELNTDRRILYTDGREVPLTQSEQKLLMVFYTMGRRVLDIDLLIDSTLDHPVKVPEDVNIIHNLIHRLRRKAGSRVIETRKGQGYLLAEEIRIVESNGR